MWTGHTLREIHLLDELQTRIQWNRREERWPKKTTTTTNLRVPDERQAVMVSFCYQQRHFRKKTHQEMQWILELAYFVRRKIMKEQQRQLQRQLRLQRKQHRSRKRVWQSRDSKMLRSEHEKSHTGLLFSLLLEHLEALVSVHLIKMQIIMQLLGQRLRVLGMIKKAVGSVLTLCVPFLYKPPKIDFWMRVQCQWVEKSRQFLRFTRLLHVKLQYPEQTSVSCILSAKESEMPHQVIARTPWLQILRPSLLKKTKKTTAK